MNTLDDTKHMISDLWLDQPDAGEQIDARLAAGAISEVEAQRLHHFTTHGYTTLSLGLDEDFSRTFEADLDHLWQTKPVDLAVSAKSGDRESFRDFGTAHRSVGYRIVDLHSHSPVALGLYLNRQIFRMVELIFDQKAVAFQSLYFQFGSEQSLHRDPMFVVTKPPSHLIASWTALEDINPGCGPLLYVPGSHRMPWFEFEEDMVEVGKTGNEREKRNEWVQHRKRVIEELGLEIKEFTCKRGDVFIWHGGLLHGGAAVTDQGSTRKSYVVHYGTAATYTSRRATMKMKFIKDGNEIWRGVEGTTDEFLVNDGCTGLDNPLRRMQVPVIPAPSRLRGQRR